MTNSSEPGDVSENDVHSAGDASAWQVGTVPVLSAAPLYTRFYDAGRVADLLARVVETRAYEEYHQQGGA